MIGRSFGGRFETDVESLILLLVADFDWHYGQANEDFEDVRILAEFLVL